jgi:hypothetical protein
MVTAVKRTLPVAGLIGAAFLVAILVGCGGHATGRTSIKLVASGFGGKAVFHLRCDPAGGDIAHPARACAALQENPDALLHPRPFTCLADSWHISINGQFKGRPVNVKTETCWTPQMELIDRLGIANQLDTHFVSYGSARRDLLAKRVEVPAATSAWLIAMAQSEAGWLQDARPGRMRIRLGRVDVIELWGHFSCVMCSRPLGAKSPSGTYARITVDPGKRVVTSLSLKRAKR